MICDVYILLQAQNLRIPHICPVNERTEEQ